MPALNRWRTRPPRSGWKFRLLVVLAGLSAAIIGTDSLVAQQGAISFSRDIRPLLADRCFHCHGPDATNQESEFRLDTAENAFADLGGYAGIVPGELDASELHHRIHSEDDDRMPPASEVRQLSPSERALLDAWIEAGAPFERHWSFQPLPREIAIPPGGADWATQPIDHFVWSRMSEQGLQPAPPTDRSRWLRRVTFDLTGLPPTPAEHDAFLADPSPQAYERVVDRLLASDAAAERLATEWLDVARYSDTYGFQTDHPRFVWPYRDWVIRAFQKNLPYDQFLTEQIAGDLLPNASQDQIVATCFNRLHSHKKEGGSSREEFRIENVADRTQTFASAFLGLTFECARCHDHKYDPISTREYYELSAFFANVDENGIISFFTDAAPTPAQSLFTDADRAALKEAEMAIEKAEAQCAEARGDSRAEFESWLEQLAAFEKDQDCLAHLDFESWNGGQFQNLLAPEHPATSSPDNEWVEARKGKAVRLTGDDPVTIPQAAHFDRAQPFTFSLWICPQSLAERAVIYRRSRGWDDAGSIGYELTQLGGKLSAKLVHFWPGNAISVTTGDVLQAGEWTHVAVTWDGSSKAAGLQIFVDGEPALLTIDQDALTRQIRSWSGGDADLAIGSRFRDRGFAGGMVDDFRVYRRQLAGLEIAQLHDGQTLDRILENPPGECTPAEREQLWELFLRTDANQVAAAREELAIARRRWNEIVDRVPALTVMKERTDVRPTHVLRRGAYDQPGDQVTAGTPKVLPPLPPDAPANRLGLARWLVDPDHPLTARVAVNRYWQLVFGKGLVGTPEDFGVQGTPPTHPELLDWLARDFVEYGWDLKRLLKQLVLSATYRQESAIPSESRSRDPDNRWYARGPVKRMSAEMIRDQALFASGLLVPKIGGPSVRPYDLQVAFKPSGPDQGEGLYRRSLYTYWQRTGPSPAMMTLNASKREVCRLKRDEVDSTLQAFVLLNGTQFVEASRVLGCQLLARHGEDWDAIIEEGFRRVLTRSPSDAEREIFQRLVAEQCSHYRAREDAAMELLQVGEAPLIEGPRPEQAAATVLVNTILNLDESVRLR